MFNNSVYHLIQWPIVVRYGNFTNKANEDLIMTMIKHITDQEAFSRRISSDRQ